MLFIAVAGEEILSGVECDFNSTHRFQFNSCGSDSSQFATNTVILAQARIQKLKPLDTGFCWCDVNTPVSLLRDRLYF